MQNLNLYQYLKVKNNHRPLVFNSVLWLLLFTLLLVVFTKGTPPITVDFAFTSVFVILLTFPVLINFYVLIPQFLKNERYLSYALLLLIIWLVFSYVIDQGIHPILDALFTNLFFISYPRGINIYIITSIVLLATSLLKLGEDWIYFNTNENRLLRLKNTQVENQLSALRTQTNPHFLFNSLNVIYALALEKNEQITHSILQLSDILRYVLYDSNVDRIIIAKEINLLKNYIQFQEVRDRIQHKVTLHINLENETFNIYPMLLLPLVENAYKHSNLTSNSNYGYITINLEERNGKLTFKIKNSKSLVKIDSMYESSGIGMENIKTNLKLVYPDSHRFLINETEDDFEVELTIWNDYE